MLKYNKIQPGVQPLDPGYCLRYESARQVLHAERFARSTGNPMNMAVTISFTRRLKKGVSAKTVFTEIRNKVQRAWNYRRKKGKVKGPLYYIAVFENPEFGRWCGNPVYGPLHVHWMMRWSKIPTNIIEQIVNRVMRKYSLGTPRKCVNIQQLYNPVGYAMYIAKGIDPPYARHYHLQHRPQGPVPFKRVVISNQLGTAARRKYTAQHGLHPFAIANKARSGKAWKYVGLPQRNRMKRRRPWRNQTLASVRTMMNISPQSP